MASMLGGCSNGESAFAPLAAGAVAPGTPAPTAERTSAPSPGPLAVSPASIAIGAENPPISTFSATEANYTSGYTEADNCSGIAAIVPGQSAVTTSSNGTSSSAQQYNVAQLGAGSCTARVADNHGGVRSVAIASTVYGTLTASPANVSLGNGAATSTTVAIAETGYVGSFSQSSDCAGIATIGLSSSTGPNATLSIAQLAAGNCTVDISDNHGGAITVAIASTTSTVIIDSHGGNK